MKTTPIVRIREYHPVLFLSAIMLMLPIQGVFGQQGTITAEQQIVAALQTSADGWNQGNLDQHVSIYDTTATFMTGQGPRRGIPIIREMLEKAYWVDGKPVQQLRFEEIVVTPLGTDFALATGKFILSGGGREDKSGRFSLIWKHTAGGWKTIHDHSS